MIDTEKINECCGCGACESVCPKKAIKMKENSKGFFYPEIDTDRCVNCSLCEKICDFRKEHKNSKNIKEIYAYQHKSDSVLKNSSSGGAFTGFSDIILNEGGLVYGVAFDSEFNAKHFCAETKEERDRFRSSKYVQSFTQGLYEEIKEKLKTGRKILFSGTPCQCAGLISFLGEKPENLFIADLLCHGTPSNKILKDHIKYWESLMNNKAVFYNYRSKKYGHEQNHEIIFSDSKRNTSVELKKILKLFAVSMRESCYNCPYASQYRYGDITIGDLWESAKTADILNHKGTSLILINTEKGKELLQKAKNDAIIRNTNYDINSHQALNHPTKKPESCDSFWDIYLSEGYKKAIDRYGRLTFRSLIYQSLLRFLYITKTDIIFEYIKKYL